jgi:choline dehydrogenase
VKHSPLTGCQVARLRLAAGERGLACSGVEFLEAGTQWYAHAEAETVLAAGAIGSPHLLQLSGIGPARQLLANGVPVALDAPGVGGNLQDHLQIRTSFKVKGVKTLNALASTWFGKAMIGTEYALMRSGPMSMAPSQLGAFTRSDPDCGSPMHR